MGRDSSAEEYILAEEEREKKKMKERQTDNWGMVFSDSIGDRGRAVRQTFMSLTIKGYQIGGK